MIEHVHKEARDKEARDEDIVCAVLNGDVEQYGLLIQRYQQVLWAMAYSRLRDHRQAGESVHDAFVNAYLSLNSLKKRDRFGAWVRTILYNTCLKTLEKKSRERTLSEQVEDDNPNPQSSLELDFCKLRFFTQVSGVRRFFPATTLLLWPVRPPRRWFC